MNTAPDNIPPDYRPLPGSERQPAPNARLVGPADPGESFNVTIALRSRTGGPPLPDLSETPAIGRPALSPDEYAERYGADPADIATVVAFAESKGLKITETHADQRTVIVSGTVSQMNEAFAVTLGRYEQPGVGGADDKETYRGREGSIYIPGSLTGIITGVFGLDNRRMARRH